MAGLFERDLRLLITVVEDGKRDEPTAGIPWAVLEGVAGLIGCSEVSWVELDRGSRRRPVQQDRGEDGSQVIDLDLDGPGDEKYWEHYRAFLPCSGPASVSGSAIRWSEIYGPRELRNTALYSEYFGPFGVTDCLFVGLPTLPHHTRRLLCWREGGSFTSRDSLVLELLRPHLTEVHRDAQLRRAGIPRLTGREWEVLRLAAEGNSNADIARLLFISVGTVRTHMEHVFDRTGVRTRGAAVAKMMPRLLGGPPGP